VKAPALHMMLPRGAIRGYRTGRRYAAAASGFEQALRLLSYWFPGETVLNVTGM
jgi:hypothetical protein